VHTKRSYIVVRHIFNEPNFNENYVLGKKIFKERNP